MIRLAESATRAVSARGAGQLALHGFGDAAAHVGVRGQEDHLRVRAVFRLRQQVRGDKVRVGAAVGDHQHFRRAGRHVDGCAVQTLADLAFGFRDVSVARAKDFIHLRHRLGTEGEGGDGLAPPTLKMVYAAQLCGIEDLIGNRRRRAEHHLLTAGDARRRRQHQHRGEQRR